MTREDFISKVPATIVHLKHGYGELKTLIYMNKSYMAWYRHEKSKITGTSFGNNWKEVYDNVSSFLSEEGLVNK